MKKFYTFTIGLSFLVISAFSQVTLTYEKHGLAADNLNEMKLTEWVEPGVGGENQTWDYSNLAPTNDFEGTVAHTYEAPDGNLFPKSNVALNEFGNRFYFNLNQNMLEQYGLVNSSGKLVINYDRPFVKMQYPFSYGDFFTGTYGGTYKFSTVEAMIEGTYTVEADGFGSLSLPGDKFINNTLRVKTIREYDRIFDNHTTNMKVTTYRWYSNNDRFPLLVLTTMESTTNNNTHTTYQAAYRENITTDIVQPVVAHSLNLYPNPFRNIVNLTYNVESEGTVLIEIYDNTGKLVNTLVDEIQQANTYNLELNNAELGLAKGLYIIKTTINGVSTTKQLVKE